MKLETLKKKLDHHHTTPREADACELMLNCSDRREFLEIIAGLEQCILKAKQAQSRARIQVGDVYYYLFNPEDVDSFVEWSKS